MSRISDFIDRLTRGPGAVFKTAADLTQAATQRNLAFIDESVEFGARQLRLPLEADGVFDYVGKTRDVYKAFGDTAVAYGKESFSALFEAPGQLRDAWNSGAQS